MISLHSITEADILVVRAWFVGFGDSPYLTAVCDAALGERVDPADYDGLQRGEVAKLVDMTPALALEILAPHIEDARGSKCWK
jgi:hypothetical protein